MAKADKTLASRLNYAQCWEDVNVLRDALQVGPGDEVLSIASAGDNAFALAMAGAKVTAVDLSAAQLALCEFKLRAAQLLDHGSYRVLFGLDPGDPQRVYVGMRAQLPPHVRDWVDTVPQFVIIGILGAGRFEQYLDGFRRWVLPLIHRRRTVDGWFDLPDLAAQRRYFTERWDTRRWRALFRVFFSKRVMQARGRSPEQFAYVDGEIGDALLARVEHVMCEVPLVDNTYVQWMLTGRWRDDRALPPWLTREGQRQLADAGDRITFVQGRIQDAAADRAFTAFNLSDVPEYLSVPETRELYDAILARARSGARIAYWNLFVPRERPLELADRVIPLVERAAELHAGDRAFVYGAFRLEQVT